MYEACRMFCKSVIKVFRRMALQKHITSKQIARMPLVAYRGEIVYVKDDISAASAVNELLTESILGFDTESRPAFKKGEYYPPSLIQIAGSKKVFLFHMVHVSSLDVLRPILENGKIMKVGSAIQNDVKHLQRIKQFDAKGFFDLGLFSSKLGIVYTGLRNLAAIFLRIRISKSSQLTDWSSQQLTDKQILYAATDAWVSREIFFKMARLL